MGSLTSSTTPGPVGMSFPTSPHYINRIKFFGKPVLKQVTISSSKGTKDSVDAVINVALAIK